MPGLSASRRLTGSVSRHTHVHQIAMKHYGMKGSAGNKVPMTPKLYDTLTGKFVDIWGEYAGWAHSVSCNETTQEVY